MLTKKERAVAIRTNNVVIATPAAILPAKYPALFSLPVNSFNKYDLLEVAPEEGCLGWFMIMPGWTGN